jgi:hypothetical protein
MQVETLVPWACWHGVMDERLAELRVDERAACFVAERVTGGVAEPWDVNGRQGAVDAMLTLPDGRTAAFEVMGYDEDYGIQIDRLLGADDNHWPVVGKWWWTIQVGSRSDVPRLRQSYERIIQLCEAVGAERPDQLWSRHWEVDPDIAWLMESSSSNMWGHPEVPAIEGDKVRDVMVTSTGRGGGVDTSLRGLHAALVEMFPQDGVAKHLRKVADADADEGHLCLLIHRGALPFAVADGLWTGTTLPPEPPPLPERVTHLWLMSELGGRVLLWTPNGWQQHRPYDEPAADETDLGGRD